MEQYMKKTTGFWVLGIAAMLVFGSWLRMAHLGQPSLHVDEYYHVLAADQILQGNGPKLPSGNDYSRAFPFTLSIAGSFKLFGESDASARIPSVLYGLLSMLLVMAVAWRWFGKGAALVAVTLMAVSPTLVDTSRMCRMYSLFQLLYLWAAFAYAFCWERKHNSWPIKVLGTFWCLVLIYLGLKIHPLMQGIVPAILGFWIVMALTNWKSRHALFAIFAILGGIAAVSLGFVNVDRLLEKINYAPSWADSRRYLYGFYVHVWSQDFAWIWWCMPFAIGWGVWRYRMKGLFVVCLFGIPFLLHSLIFDWKEGRYVSHLLPFAILVLSPFLADCVTFIKNRLKTPTIRSLALVLIGMMSVMVLMPTVDSSKSLQDDPTRPRWREAVLKTQPLMDKNAVIVASIPLAISRYLGREADYTLNNFDTLDYQDKMSKDDKEKWVDWYTGSKLITSLEDLMEVIPSKNVWVYLDKYRYESDKAVPQNLKAYLRETCKDIEATTDASIRVFHCEN